VFSNNLNQNWLGFRTQAKKHTKTSFLCFFKKRERKFIANGKLFLEIEKSFYFWAKILKHTGLL